MKSYSCPNCGAQIVTDGTTVATSCPYCANPTVIPGKLEGQKKPDMVIPFRLNKDQAIQQLKMHYKGKKLLPDTFRDQNHLEEIKGVYVPFWLFDSEVNVDMDLNASQNTVSRMGNQEITRTRHYSLERSGKLRFEHVPVDGSSKMPDDYMDSIAPFDFQELKEFSTAYLPGFFADIYDVSAEDCITRAEESMQTSAREAVLQSVGQYGNVTVAREQLDIQRGKISYALLPVWMLSTRWNGQVYLFAMNGQTGKMVGDLPVSRAKYWQNFASIMIPVAVLLGIALYFI